MDEPTTFDQPARENPRATLAREEVTQILRRALAERREVVAGYLFGSYARDRATAESDVDVALLLDAAFDCADPLYRVRVMSTLASSLGRSVDVVILNNAPLVLRHQVLTYGRRIHETDRRQRIAYEVRSRQLYFDFRPILDTIAATMRRHIKEGTYGHQYRGHRDPLGDARRAAERLDSAEDYDVGAVRRKPDPPRLR